MKRFSSIFKNLTPYGDYIKNAKLQTKHQKLFNQFFLFTLTFLPNQSFDSEYGILYIIKKHLLMINTLKGYLITYSKRQEMLGRKTDFRNKLLNKKTIAF
jgi:hypothetical protein